MSQTNWPYLTTISISNRNIYWGGNKIGIEGAKFLSQSNWPLLTVIIIGNKKIYLGPGISRFGVNFLKSVQWSAHPNFSLRIWLYSLNNYRQIYILKFNIFDDSRKHGAKRFLNWKIWISKHYYSQHRSNDSLPGGIPLIFYVNSSLISSLIFFPWFKSQN